VLQEANDLFMIMVIFLQEAAAFFDDALAELGFHWKSPKRHSKESFVARLRKAGAWRTCSCIITFKSPSGAIGAD
jgi:hypothetical protein